MSLSYLRRTVPRRMVHHYMPPPQEHQPPQYQFLNLPIKGPLHYPDVKPAPTWTKPSTGLLGAEAQQLPKIQWVSAYEYEQQRGQPEAMEAAGLTEALWAKWSDLHYRLVDSADKYLVDNAAVDDTAAADVWARWTHEAEEHLAYHGIMSWRYNSFTESNLEVVPPGELREELRYTAPNDLHPDVQEQVFKIRQQWLPAHFRFVPLPDPMRTSRQHVANRQALLDLVDAQEAEWVGKASTAQEAALVGSYCNLWRRSLAPSAHVTVAAIEACNDLPTLQEMFELVFADNGDDRLFAIARKATALTGDAAAAKLAEWCAGVAARDADADARAVSGVKVSASKPSEEEARRSTLPGDFSDITSGDALAEYLSFYEAHWRRALVTYAPKERAVITNAWEAFKTAVGSLKKVDGAEVRLAWWTAMNNATPGAYYAPPLLPVRKDAHGTRFALRMFGALGKQGVFDGVYAKDPSYVADALSFVDFKLLSQAEVRC